MSNCARCGTSFGFLDDLCNPIPPYTGMLCTRCAMFLRTALLAWEQRLEWLFSDGMWAHEREADLRAYQAHLGLTDWDVGAKVQRMRALTAISAGELPVVSPGNVMLPRGEVAHFGSGAALYQEQYSRNYVSKTTTQSRGSNYRGKGRIFGSFGSRRGTSSQTRVGGWVQTAEWVCVGQGTFLVTSANVRFLSHEPVTVPLEEVLGFNVFANGIQLQYEGHEGKDVYVISDGEWAAAVMVAARRKLEGVDPPEGPYR